MAGTIITVKDSDNSMVTQALEEKQDELVKVIETATCPDFINELVLDIQSLARVRNQLK